MNGFVLNMNGFALNMNGFTFNMTLFFLNITEFDDDDDESNEVSYMNVLPISCFPNICYEGVWHRLIALFSSAEDNYVKSIFWNVAVFLSQKAARLHVPRPLMSPSLQTSPKA